MKLRMLKGTKDYMPEEQVVRERIRDTLVSVFKRYGYRPIETTILDFYDIASNKYTGGEEILKEVYRLNDQGGRDLVLRYELTFKLAKLIGMNPNIKMPFKRYEIGKVFRDGPVKTGRLREFTQCDVDVVGIKSAVADAEFMSMVFDVFKELKLDVYIQVNNRKLLFGLIESCGISDNDTTMSIILSLDKIEKFGKKSVVDELIDKGIDKDVIDKIFSYLEVSGKTNKEKLDFFGKIKNENVKQGVNELREFFDYCKSFGIKKDIVFVPTLARGLGYYTGLMWEVYLKNSSIRSSVGAGGRWNDMIKQFLQSNRNYPSTGMTFGLDVIYEALKEKGFDVSNELNVFVVPIDTLDYCLGIAKKLRDKNINCDIAFEKKLSKALDYANYLNVPFVIIVGKDEIKKNKLKLKDMKTGKEELVSLNEIINRLE